MFSLFALMNGDVISECYNDLDTIDYLLSQVFLYTFISVSILVVQNVFIAIISDGYQISKYVKTTDWVKQASHLPVNPQILQPVPQNAFTRQGMSMGYNKMVTEANPFAKLYKRKHKSEQSRQTLGTVSR